MVRKISRFLNGVLTGAAVGAALALLFAPAPGDELRARWQQRAQGLLDEVRQAAQERRAELEAELARLRGETPPEAP